MMNPNGPLATLLRRAASRYRGHDSKIGQLLAMAITEGIGGPVQNPPARIINSSILLDALSSEVDPLLSDVLDIADHLPWRASAGASYNAKVSSKIDVVELLGPDGMIRSERCRFGLLLQHPHFLYPAHRHEAEELYLVLSGHASWTIDGGDPFMQRSGMFAHHEKGQLHAMRTEAAPLLALWGWIGDLDLSTYSMPEP